VIPFIATMLLALAGLAVYCLRLQVLNDALQRQSVHFDQSLEELFVLLQRLQGQPETLARRINDLCALHLDADGTLIVTNAELESLPAYMPVLACTGICTGWVETAGDQQAYVMASLPQVKDFYFSRRCQHYTGSKVSGWIAQPYCTDVCSVVVAPLQIADTDVYFILVRSVKNQEFDRIERNRFSAYMSVADLEFGLMRADQSQKNLEQHLTTAHEEGMLQVLSGVIHNIGNGLTVVQLALEHLQRADLAQCHELAELLNADVVPTIQDHLERGDLARYLQEDPDGMQLFAMLRQAIEKMQQGFESYRDEIRYLSDQFQAITDVIGLQQQFIGELGTENVCDLTTVMAEVELICRSGLECRTIQLVPQYEENARVLVDGAMLRHVLILLIREAAESVVASTKSNALVQLKVETAEVDDVAVVRIIVEDNGTGEPVNVDSIDETLDDRSRAYQSAREFAKKYGGHLLLDCRISQQTSATLELPAFTGSEDE
jgi:signal transduction histidine kinase